MNVELGWVGREFLPEVGYLLTGETGVDFQAGKIGATLVPVPIGGKLVEVGLLGHGLRGLLGFAHLSADFGNLGFDVCTKFLRVDLVKGRVLLNALVDDRLGNGWIVHFGVSMT